MTRRSLIHTLVSFCAWKTVADHPFPSARINGYAMVYMPETRSCLVIGGTDGDGNGNLLQIAKIQGEVWSDAGRLNSAV